ncbi:KEOPS complex Pcc1-like subunit [Natrarchaeobius halalkaliphilus]|uniref:KEOPS complex Pcc1-like subunit n=1 Tax=Natrarchaeobius halalkaliphilus TaxID=1679091 RepID=A0A3N6MS71_9EURY|nr:KEOPS complex subunit Pcc1 [Natrarchaeobius halalkaliphilus]RQG87073.1 KEOPS complex Pcc1-like subunit [Natrarchaeobius halalkaliphilus]
MTSHDATLEFEYGCASTARTVAESVRLEIGDIDDDRSRTAIERTDSTVRLEVAADDAVALRAALNTWFSLVDVAEQAGTLGEYTLERR